MFKYTSSNLGIRFSLVWMFGLVAILFSSPSTAQTFGDEWINPGQTYFKIPVYEEGIYQVTATQLNQLGLGGADPRKLQIFHRGEEIAIRVEGEENGTLDPGDFIEFYGQRNDGTQDIQLYRPVVGFGYTVNSYYNLYSDTTAYFLTLNTGLANGKRMPLNVSLSTGNTPAYHWQEEVRVYSDDYSIGQNYPVSSSVEIYKSGYDRGQGWTSNIVRSGSSLIVSFPVSQLQTISDGSTFPNLEVFFVGATATAADYEVQVQVSTNNSSWRSLGNVQGRYIQEAVFNGNINYSDIGSGVVYFRFVPVVATFRVSYVKFRYPQAYNNQGLGVQHFEVPADISNTSLIQIQNVSSGASLFDISDPNNVAKIDHRDLGGSIEFTLDPSGNIRKLYLLNQARKAVTTIETIQFPSINPNDYDYIIISNQALRKPAGGNPDIIQAYADFRASPAGGSYRPLIVNIHDLYNKYSYGEITPLAMQRFADRMFREGVPKYILLIGKAISFPDRYFRPSGSTGGTFLDMRRNPDHAALNLVPTWGFPPSDIAIVAGLGSSGGVYPSIPIGRISATNADEVWAYLEKLIEHEQVPLEDWQKNILHLSGGNNEGEQVRFKGYLSSYGDIASGDLVGAQITATGKSTTSPVEIVNVSEQVNAGISLVTFFGHSAATITDVEIGNASDDIQGYRNKGRYPIMLTNGCQLGAIFYNSPTLSEDWLFTRDRGCIGFIAHCYLGYEQQLRGYSDSFYETAYNSSLGLGRPIGDVIQQSIRRNLSPSQVFDVAHAQQMIYQGDPAVRFFKASEPDYSISQASLSLTSFDQEVISSESDSFNLQIIVRNLGVNRSATFQVQVRQTFRSGEQRVLLNGTDYGPIQYLDTLNFTIPNNDSISLFGTNRFEVFVDYNDQILEENETNNIAVLEAFIPNRGVTPVYPLEYSIVNRSQVSLSALANNTVQNQQAIVFELDTSNSFNSPALQTTIVPSSLNPSWSPNLLLANPGDTIVYYWRTNFANAENDPLNVWGESSFTYIPGSAPGWTQRNNLQFDKIQTSRIQRSMQNPVWRFEVDKQMDFEIRTYGADYPDSVANNFVFLRIDGDPYVNGLNLDDLNTPGYGAIVAMRLGRDLEIFPAINEDNACCRNGQSNLFDNTDIQGGALSQFLDLFGPGETLLLFSVGDVHFNDWPSSLRSRLEQFGANPFLYQTLQNGHPYILLGQLGSQQGSAQEAVASNVNNPRQDFLSYNYALQVPFSQGSLRSTLVGPADEWKSFHFNAETVAQDDVYYEIIGRRADGSESSTPLLLNVRSTNTDLSAIDSEEFPYLTIQAFKTDLQDLTAPQLDNWLVLYDGVPEALLDIDAVGREKYIISDKQEGESINLEYVFANVSDFTYESDSLLVRYTITNQDNLSQEIIWDTIAAPPVDGFVSFTQRIETRGRSGQNTMEIFVNPRLETESFYENNSYMIDFLVLPDNKNPLLEVTFDGREILDGEIVSPQPLINVLLRDNNTFLDADTDRSELIVALKKPCEGCDYEDINLQSDGNLVQKSGGLTQVEFQPELGENGVYSLRVQGIDDAGNTAGVNPYEINFEVVNESTVTHFYPYPNPFSSNCRFVFTLTGSSIPDEIKIQIMTVSGYVVREITQDELGPIRIGNNLTEFAWDGTDEYGDKLANGVYLYRVLLKGQEQDFQHRETSADKAFKKGFGKLYILR